VAPSGAPRICPGPSGHRTRGSIRLMRCRESAACGTAGRRDAIAGAAVYLSLSFTGRRSSSRSLRARSARRHEVDATGHSKLSGFDGATRRWGEPGRALRRRRRAEARIRGLRISRAQLVVALVAGNREVSATGGEHVASARASGNRSRESRSVMWIPGSGSGGEARAFGSLATIPS
jgi:hypothetical protein